MPRYYVEEGKISRQLTKTDFEECDRHPLPDVPVHFQQSDPSLIICLIKFG
jgi:hypothetical protein